VRLDEVTKEAAIFADVVHRAGRQRRACGLAALGELARVAAVGLWVVPRLHRRNKARRLLGRIGRERDVARDDDFARREHCCLSVVALVVAEYLRTPRHPAAVGHAHREDAGDAFLGGLAVLACLIDARLVGCLSLTRHTGPFGRLLDVRLAHARKDCAQLIHRVELRLRSQHLALADRALLRRVPRVRRRQPACAVVRRRVGLT
jgi:hypothetical protein